MWVGRWVSDVRGGKVGGPQWCIGGKTCGCGCACACCVCMCMCVHVCEVVCVCICIIHRMAKISHRSRFSRILRKTVSIKILIFNFMKESQPMTHPLYFTVYGHHWRTPCALKRGRDGMSLHVSWQLVQCHGVKRIWRSRHVVHSKWCYMDGPLDRVHNCVLCSCLLTSV